MDILKSCIKSDITADEETLVNDGDDRIRKVTLRTRNSVREKIASDGTVLASSAKQKRGSKIRFLISSFSQYGYVTFGRKIASFNIPVVGGTPNPDLIDQTIQKLVKENPHLPHIQIEVGLKIVSENGIASLFLPANNTAIFQSTDWNYSEQRRFYNINIEDRAERTAQSIFTKSSETFSQISMVLIRMSSL